MSLDLERDDESIPPDEGEEGINDIGDISGDIVRMVRSDTQIILLEARFIEENTEFEPDIWIILYAEKFRKIVAEQPGLTDFQIKYLLYKR